MRTYRLDKAALQRIWRGDGTMADFDALLLCHGFRRTARWDRDGECPEIVPLEPETAETN